MDVPAVVAPMALAPLPIKAQLCSALERAKVKANKKDFRSGRKGKPLTLASFNDTNERIAQPSIIEIHFCDDVSASASSKRQSSRKIPELACVRNENTCLYTETHI